MQYRFPAIRLLIGVALATLAAGAAASVGINKSFSPNSVSAGQSSSMTIVLLNPNTSPATSTSVTDTLPANVVVGTAPVSNTCGGTVDATPGSGSVSLSGGTIPAAVGTTSGQCQFTVGVLSNAAGTYVNTIPASAVSSSQGSNSQPAQASLVVAALVNITGTKTFAPAVLHGGGSASTVTIQLANANGVPLTGVAYTDTFPASLALATPPNATNTCGGTLTAVAGGTSVQLSGGTVPANGSCAVTFQIVTPDPTTAVNAARTNQLAANTVTSTQGVKNSAISGNVTVQTGAAVAKAFSPTTIASGGTASLTLTISNFNATALGNIALTDTFPAGMTVANPSAASTTCGGTLTANPGGGSVDLSGGALGAAPATSGAATCTIKVNVTATNAGASPATLTNTIAAGSFAGINHAAASAGLVVNPASPITGTKTYSPAPVVSGTTTATVTLTNTTGAAATITSFTDNLTTAGTGFTVGASPAPGGTCGATIVAPPGGTSVTASGGTIPVNGSCTITFPIAIAANVAIGGHVNTIAVNGVQTTQGNNAVAIAGSIDAAAAFTGTKQFSPTSVEGGAKSTATLSLAHNANAVALSNVSFTDTLPAGHTVASPPNASTTCGGTLTANAGAGTFSLAGGSLGAGATTCKITVDVATPATAGSATNTIAAGTITTAEGATNLAFSGALTRVLTSVTINKSFSPTTVAVGGTSQLSIQIRNNNAGAIALSGLGLVDTFPIGMTGGGSAGLGFTGTGCSAGASGGLQLTATQLTLSNASVAANAICTLTATVKATAAGNLIDTLPVGIVTDLQSVTNPAVAAATLASSGSANLSISNADGVSTVTPGGATTYTVAVSNAGPNDVAGLLVSDAPAPGVTFLSWTCSASAGSQCTASGSGAIADTTTLLNGGTLTYTIHAGLAPSVSGTTTNTASLGVPGSVIDTNPSTSASDTDTIAPITSLAVTKDDGSATYVPGLGATYTIVVANGGPSDAQSVTVSDTLPAGATLSGSATCVASGAASCGSVSGAAGQSSFVAAGAAVPAGAGNQLTFTVPVAFAPNMAAGSITNTVTVTDAPSGGSASASDTDTRAPAVALGATKSDGASTYTPGKTGTYTIGVTNAGPSAAVDVSIADPLPSGVALIAPAGCLASAGSSCGTLSGSAGATSAGVAGAVIAPGGMLTLSLPVRFGAAMTAASVANTATASDGASGASTFASDVDTRSGAVALAITKTDGSTTYTPGGNATYVIVVTNNGVSDAHAVAIDDPLPAGVSLASGATCTPAGVSTCGTVTAPAGGSHASVSGATIAAGAGNSITLTLPVTFAPGMSADPLVNTASASDPDDAAAHAASDSDALSRNVVLAVTKSDGSATYTPGGSATYTATVANTGTSDAASVAVTDALPAGARLAGAVTCAATGSASCGTVTGGAGATSFAASNASLPAGGAALLTFTVPVAFASSLATDPLVNTVTASDASGATASASDSDARNGSVALALTKSDGSASYTPGGSAVYIIVLTNAGPSDATAVEVTDALPAGVTLSASVGCAATGSASCGSVTGAAGQAGFTASGARVGAAPGDALTFTVPVSFAPSVSADPLVNSVSAIDVPTGASASASDADTRSLDVSLAVVKTDGSASYTPGSQATYTVTVTNGGVSDAQNVSVSDTLPAGATLSGGVTCVANGNSSCGAVTGTGGEAAFGATGARVGAGSGSAIVYTVPVAFAAALATDPLVNTANAVDLASGASGSGSDSDARLATVSLAVAKTDGRATYTPGDTATYAVTVANNGASDALDVAIDDALPAGVTLSGSVSCVANGDASCGALAGIAGDARFGASGARIAAGGGNSVVLSAPVRFDSALVDDPIVNTATASDRASGASGSGSDSDARAARVSLTIGKTDGSATYTPGGSGVYTIVAGNDGPSDAADVAIADTLPSGVTLAADVSCTANGDASCGTVAGSAGQGSFSATGATIGAGAGNTLTFVVPVAFAATLTANPLVNTVSALDSATGAAASATDSDALSASVSLAVITTDGMATYTPGGTGTYRVTVTNGGVSDAVNITIADALPADVTLTGTVTCTASGTSSCGTVTGSAGQLAFGATGAFVASGAGNGLLLTAPVSFATGMSTSPLVNTATALDLASGASGSDADADVRLAQSGLRILKTDGSATYAPGGTATYVITVTNNGPSSAGNVTVTDALPQGVTLAASVSCAANGTASCGVVSGLAGATVMSVTGAAIAAGAGNSLSISVPVRFASSMRTDPLVNTASASANGASPVSASDSDARAGQAVIAVTVTDNATEYLPGGTGTYMIRITNIGPSDAAGVSLVDNLPAGVTLAGPPACSTEGAAACGALTGAGGGNVVTLDGGAIAAGAANAIVVVVPVRFALGLAVDRLVNAVSASASGSAPASGTDIDVRNAPPPAREIPVDRPLALVLLIAAIALVRVARRR